MKPEQLRSVHLYIVASAANGERIRKALAHGGGEIFIVDPGKPIPQRSAVVARIEKEDAAVPR